ncbi:MAG: DNA cytosine methyltransferase [Caulobacteraceae bacterium]
MGHPPFTFYEFFAGGGMARAGLGERWRCLFANDFDPKKAAVYRDNWGDGELLCGDVAHVQSKDLPGSPDLAWASFPCQDLSLAGDCRGLGKQGANQATRSGAFWPFWRAIEALSAEGRAPTVLVLENVLGTLTSSHGGDFVAIAEVLAKGGYRFGALVVDARWFLPQSRPRVFIVAVRADHAIPDGLACASPDERWAPAMLIAAHRRLTDRARAQWVWWDLPRPTDAPRPLAGLLEREPADEWHSPAETQRLLAMMSPANLAKVEQALAKPGPTVGALYRRTRPAPDGGRRVRAEVRFDNVAGCLRTPSGGSSRQKVLIAENGEIRSRLLSGREAARLMGLPESYKLPARYNDAYHVAGDGVAVPVVRHLAKHLIEPVVSAYRPGVAIAAE